MHGHSNNVNVSNLEYARSVGATLKESVKRAAHLAQQLGFKMYRCRHFLPRSTVLRNSTSAYGASVRQRTVQKETTMAKHGTLPEFPYQHDIEVGDNVNLGLEDVKKPVTGSNEGQNELYESSDEDVDCCLYSTIARLIN